MSVGTGGVSICMVVVWSEAWSTHVVTSNVSIAGIESIMCIALIGVN